MGRREGKTYEHRKKAGRGDRKVGENVGGSTKGKTCKGNNVRKKNKLGI